MEGDGLLGARVQFSSMRWARTMLPNLLVIALMASPALGAVQRSRRYLMRDVLELKLEKGQLVLFTTLPSSPDEAMEEIQIQGLDGNVSVNVRRDGRPGAPVPTHFALAIVRNNSKGRNESLELRWSNQSLDLQKTLQVSGAARYIQLLRFRMSPPDPEEETDDRIILSMNEVGRSRDAAPEVNIAATDFSNLLREYPTEVNHYLRPMLREIGQEALLAPDVSLAWQVFSEEWQPDDRTRNTVKALVAQMDDADRSQRDKATEQLKSMGFNGAVAVVHMDRSRLSAEQNIRLDSVMAPFAILAPAETKRLRNDVGFLLDCLNSEDATVRHAAMHRLEKRLNREMKINPDAPVADRAETVAALRNRLVSPATMPTTKP